MADLNELYQGVILDHNRSPRNFREIDDTPHPSASLMTQAVKGKSVSQAKELFASFQKLVTGKASPEESKEILGKLILFAGVSEFPVRVKCASLSWHTLNAALEDAPDAVTTE